MPCSQWYLKPHIFVESAKTKTTLSAATWTPNRTTIVMPFGTLAGNWKWYFLVNAWYGKSGTGSIIYIVTGKIHLIYIIIHLSIH
jgi:hypothetical protein